MKRFLQSAFFGILLFTANLTVFADKVDTMLPVPSDGTKKLLPDGDLKFAILPQLLKIFFALTGVITTGVFIYSGIMLVTNLGNEEVMTKFKKSLIGSGVGLAVCATAYGIVTGILKISFE